MANWRDQGACLGRDPDLWVIGEVGRNRVATEVCRRCPVQRECLEDAVECRAIGVIRGGKRMHRRQWEKVERDRKEGA